MSSSSSVAVLCLAVVVLLSTRAVLAGESKKVRGYMGETVVLPCSSTAHSDMSTLEWSRTGRTLEIAFVYRQGCETFEMKSPVFQFRTNLFMSQLSSGNMSLRFSELRLSDEGEYQCKIIEPGTKPKVVETVELFVGAASDPRLSVVSGEGDRMVLRCESNCWFPEPDITFVDDQGKDLPAHNPVRNQDPQSCFYVKRNVTLQTDTKRVTCRVHQALINQARYAEINIPAEFTHSSSGVIIAVAVVVCAIFSVAMFVFGKKSSSCVCMKKQPESKSSSDQGTAPRSTEGCTSRNEPDDTKEQNRRSTGRPGSSADTSHPTNPSDSSPNNSPPTSHSASPIRAPASSVSRQNPASPVRGQHANGSSSPVVDNNGSASSSVSSVPTSGEQNPPQLRRSSESRMRTSSASIRLSRTYTMSRRSTLHEESKRLMEPEAEPDSEG